MQVDLRRPPASLRWPAGKSRRTRRSAPPPLVGRRCRAAHYSNRAPARLITPQNPAQLPALMLPKIRSFLRRTYLVNERFATSAADPVMPASEDRRRRFAGRRGSHGGPAGPPHQHWVGRRCRAAPYSNRAPARLNPAGHQTICSPSSRPYGSEPGACSKKERGRVPLSVTNRSPGFQTSSQGSTPLDDVLGDVRRRPMQVDLRRPPASLRSPAGSYGGPAVPPHHHWWGGVAAPPYIPIERQRD
jgi:hypothetical protein